MYFCLSQGSMSCREFLGVFVVWIMYWEGGKWGEFYLRGRI